MAKLNIADIRQEYTKGGLRENELPTRFRFSVVGYKKQLTQRWMNQLLSL